MRCEGVGDHALAVDLVDGAKQRGQIGRRRDIRVGEVDTEQPIDGGRFVFAWPGLWDPEDGTGAPGANLSSAIEALLSQEDLPRSVCTVNLAGEQLDLVALCTPSGIHSDQAVLAASHKVSVMTEKPMATRWQDGVRMVKAASRRRRVGKAAGAALVAGYHARPILKQVIADPTRVAEDRLTPNPARDALRFANVSLRGWWK